jgi:flagellar protein FliO/FliZ
MSALLAILLAAQVNAVTAQRDEGVLEVRVEADAAIDAEKVSAKLESHRLLIQVPATLDAESRTFHVAHRYLLARREGEGVEVEIPIGAKVNCALPVTVSAVTNGIEVKIKCEDEKETAPTQSAAAPAVADAKPAVIVAKTIEKPVEKSVVVEKPAPVVAKAVESRIEPKAEAPKFDLDAKPETKSTPFGAIAIVIVFAGLACAAVFARKKKRSTSTIQVLETAALGPKRSLILAKVGGRTLLLSSSEAGIALLSNIDELPTAPDARDAGPSQDIFEQLDEHLVAKAPTRKLDVVAKLRKFTAKRPPPSFDTLFAETHEDQELRMKLLAGQSTRAQ